MEERQIIRKKLRKQYLRSYDESEWMSRLKTEGYLWLKQQIPEEMCNNAYAEILRDFDQSKQEHAIELLPSNIQQPMIAIRDYLLTNVIKSKMKLNPSIPANWDQTLYARYKTKNTLTNAHCDAFNTIVERKLLPKTFPFSNTDQFNGLNEIPIYTFWVALHEIKSNQSHLRIHPGSHRLPWYEQIGNAIEPRGYKYNADNFIGLSKGMQFDKGDVLIFHCLTQHEGSVQNIKSPRISMDGRFLL